jgi:protein-S-isoprenylcysteine O-methyltransferase Ste14
LQSIYGRQERSFAPRLFLVVGHGIIVAGAVFFLLGGALPFGLRAEEAPFARRAIVAAAALVYFARVCVTALYLLRRRMGWPEAATILVWLLFVHGGFALLAASARRPPGIADLAAGVLYLAGSFLNTGSEYARFRWKKRPENRGHLYTEGLFRFARHINYFGDTLLFAGYALFTARLVALAVPFLMACLFVFVNIPMLDRYLRSRYGAEYEAYARRTKRFVPFLY